MYTYCFMLELNMNSIYVYVCMYVCMYMQLGPLENENTGWEGV